MDQQSFSDTSAFLHHGAIPISPISFAAGCSSNLTLDFLASEAVTHNVDAITG